MVFRCGNHRFFSLKIFSKNIKKVIDKRDQKRYYYLR